MSMKKRAEPQHADPSQAIGARKSGDNPASPLPRTGSSNPLPSAISKDFIYIIQYIMPRPCMPTHNPARSSFVDVGGPL
jgi:hypothetical protein